MKILYGVVGEGMGHAIRSRVVIEHLLQGGHEVEVMASQRAAGFLANHFPNVHRIHGMHIIYEANQVRRGATLWSNALQGAAALPQQIRAYFELVEDFEPEIVVSDFESWTYLYGKTKGLPVLSIDNMQIIARTAHPPEVLTGARLDYELTRALVAGKLPFCEHYLIGTFFYPTGLKERTTLVPPILREDVLAATSGTGEHLLVYQTGEGYGELTQALTEANVECRVYGMRRDLETEVVEGKLHYRPFSEAGFIADLASARGVIAGGGFTLMSECVYLHKPLLAVPIRGQFEQVLNARYLEHLGYGLAATSVSAAAVQHFLEQIPCCAERLATYHQDGNALLFEALDHQLDKAAAGLL